MKTGRWKCSSGHCSLKGVLAAEGRQSAGWVPARPLLQLRLCSRAGPADHGGPGVHPQRPGPRRGVPRRPPTDLPRGWARPAGFSTPSHSLASTLMAFHKDLLMTLL